MLRRAQGELTASNVIQAGELLMYVDAHRVEVRGQQVHLTPTEFGFLLDKHIVQATGANARL